MAKQPTNNPPNTSTKPETSNDSGIAEPTFPPGAQSVDRDKDQALPESKPEELAPTPDASGKLPSTDDPEPSSTGYRVAQGKSITSKKGDLLDGGAEIGPDDVGGQERLDELEKAGALVKTGGASKPKADDKGDDKKPLFTDSTKGSEQK